MASPLSHVPGDDASRADAALVLRIRAGDEAAFEALFRTYFTRLASLANTYVHSPEIAEELVQDVLLRVWKGRETWDIRGSLRAYLYAAVRHRAISHLRNRRVAQRVEDEVHEVAAADRTDLSAAFAPTIPSPDAGLDLPELEAAVERAIADLPDRCRETFLLSRRHDLSQAEIAAVMGVSLKTVQAQMYNARAALRRRLAAWLED